MRRATQEAAIATAIKPASWTYAEAFVAEDDCSPPPAPAPRRSAWSPIGSGGGAALRFLASVLDARAVVEIGTGTGVSGLWLLRGMRADGVLTTVDIEAEHQRLASRRSPRPASPPSGPAPSPAPRSTCSPG